MWLTSLSVEPNILTRREWESERLGKLLSSTTGEEACDSY